MRRRRGKHEIHTNLLLHFGAIIHREVIDNNINFFIDNRDKIVTR